MKSKTYTIETSLLHTAKAVQKCSCTVMLFQYGNIVITNDVATS